MNGNTHSRGAGLVSGLAAVLASIPYLLLVLLLSELLYLQQIRSNWSELEAGRIPVSSFMWSYLGGGAREEGAVRLKWDPVPLARIPEGVQKAFIVAEDGRFYQHSGLDWRALEGALKVNLKLHAVRYGASTISQQTVKNLFLTPERSLLRKWHEMILTRRMEIRLGKRRILELYLNVAQLGEGIFGVQAAAIAYWGRPVELLGPREGAELAATLPSPAVNNPATRTPAFRRRAADIYERMGQLRR